MNLAGLGLRRAAPFFALAAIIAVALVCRLDFLIIKGGLEADQVAWARQNYAGGITHSYLIIRDAILSWSAEPRPWPYLPGYPGFLALLYKLGIKDLASARLAQIVADSLAILALYFVLYRIGRSALLALVGCLVYAIAPWWGAGSTFLLGEALLPALMIMLLAAMVLIRDRPSMAVHWFLLGLFASVLPFFRSDMLLLFGPLMVWALLVAPERRRIVSAACVVAGFVLPLLLWGARNYDVHGHFSLTPPAKWYAAWSGLGQVANEFGYFVNDERAANLLASKGISYNSLQSEDFWSNEYLAAWTNHPGHVVRTIQYRFGKILGEPDNHVIFVSRLYLKIYLLLAFIAPIALIWLLRLRRWADAFLIALPMLYAIGSLGILYVEPRYIRYAGLTYVLVLPVILGEGLDAVRTVLARHWRLLKLESLKPVAGVAAFVVVAIGAAFQLVATTRQAVARGTIARLDVNSSPPPTFRLDNIKFRPALSTVEISKDEAGLHLRARAAGGLYLLLAPTGAQGVGGAIVRYRIKAAHGGIGLGILSEGADNWLSHETPPASRGIEVDGTLVSAVERDSQIVIDAQSSDGEIDLVASKFEWTLVCPKPVGLLTLLFSKAKVPASACAPRAVD